MSDYPIDEIPPPGSAEEYHYWANKTHTERWRATIALSEAHYIKLGLYKKGQPMDMTIGRKMTREEWLLSEEEGRKDLDRT